MRSAHAPVLLLAFALLSGCAHGLQHRGERETGLASWYGREYAGRRTASGATFDPRALTCAHPTLPFGSRIAVTRLPDGPRIELRVNDRGPADASRIVDVSEEAARRLGLLGPGVAEVELELLELPEGGRFAERERPINW